ncbi:hypothetical protein HPB47_017074 [Ixodes persulcatus]|uniref:Uncharacterized protein n=1 Tax=Ixodes persulcatus TaxID=34615 RepID=A0AC60QSS8_IXOPE|nr:hypothetical protein HPB47_017074 [Ixodes persulcatus]
MRALVNWLNVGERSGCGAVKERVLLKLGLSRAEVWRPFIETTTSLKEEHKNPRQGIIPENSRVKCFKCKESGHLSRECPRKKTPDEELLFHKKRVDAENVAVEEDSSREPDKVTTDVGTTDGNNLDHQGQKRPDPLVREAPQILFQADDTKRSSKNNRSCVSVQADVDDRNELNVSRAWSRESGDSDEDAVFEMKSSQNITSDAHEDSTTCQSATCERDGGAEDVDNGDRLQRPFLIRLGIRPPRPRPQPGQWRILTRTPGEGTTAQASIAAALEPSIPAPFQGCALLPFLLYEDCPDDCWVCQVSVIHQDTHEASCQHGDFLKMGRPACIAAAVQLLRQDRPDFLRPQRPLARTKSQTSFPGPTRATGSHDGVGASAKLDVVVTAIGSRGEVQLGETEVVEVPSSEK